jgi:hypothetical protein
MASHGPAGDPDLATAQPSRSWSDEAFTLGGLIIKDRLFFFDLSIRIAIITVHQIAPRRQPHRTYENETDFVRSSFILVVTNCAGNLSLLFRCVITPAHVFAKVHQCK